MDQLSGDFRVCTYDREGVAWSKSEGANVQLEKTVARLREIVLRLLSCQHKSRVYILAHSYGALVAYAFAKKFPDLVERIVFLDPLPIASMSELPLREMKLVKKFEQRLRILRYIQHIGAVRVSGIVEAILSSLPSDVRLAGARFAASDSHYGVALNELRDWPEIAESLASLEGSRGYVSSIVLSADPPLWVPKLQPSNSRLWRELQSRYLSQPRKVPVEVVWGIDHAGLILDKSAAKWVAQRASKFFIHRTER